MRSNSVTNDNTVTSFREHRRASREALRRGVLDAAGRLLLAEGPQALTMRRISQEIDCSTTVLYTLFGNKQGLANELYLEGVASLRAALDAVDVGGDPGEALVALAHAYRANALAHPSAFAVMFQRAIPEFTPPRASVREAAQALGVLTRVVERSIAEGSIPGGDPEEIARALWAAVHGAVTLELGGHFPDWGVPAERFELVVRVAVAGCRSPAAVAHARAAVAPPSAPPASSKRRAPRRR